MTFKEQLEQAGYKTFKPNFKVGSNIAYQKRFDDDIGRKYFITIYYYHPNRYGQTDLDESWQVEMQFNGMSDSVFTVNVDVFGFKTEGQKNEYNHPVVSLQELEEFVEKMWTRMEFDYYEKWN